MLQVGERQPVMRRDLGSDTVAAFLAGAPGQLDHHAHAVLGLG